MQLWIYHRMWGRKVLVLGHESHFSHWQKHPGARHSAMPQDQSLSVQMGGHPSMPALFPPPSVQTAPHEQEDLFKLPLDGSAFNLK